MTKVYRGEPVFLERVLSPIEKFAYRHSGIDPHTEMNWKLYAIACWLSICLAYSLHICFREFKDSYHRNLNRWVQWDLIPRGIRRSALHRTPPGKDMMVRQR